MRNESMSLKNWRVNFKWNWFEEKTKTCQKVIINWRKSTWINLNDPRWNNERSQFNRYANIIDIGIYGRSSRVLIIDF